METFADLPEPRVHENKIRHKLLDIVVMTTCAVMSGIDEWWFVADYAASKQDVLRAVLGVTQWHPVPRHVLQGVLHDRPRCVRSMFHVVGDVVATCSEGRVVPIDGKTLRRSHDGDNAGPLHLVSAYCTDNALVLGQLATEEKSNEITAIPKLLDLLDVEGAIITIDAMGAQKDIVDKVCDKGADYVIGLKTNQPKLHEGSRGVISTVSISTPRQRTISTSTSSMKKATDESECRERLSATDLSGIPMTDEWAGLRSIAMVITEQIDKNGRLATEKRYYLSSLGQDATLTANAIRSHWGIENSLHWVLDVVFREDDSRVRKDNGAQNLAVIRHAALNILRQDKHSKLSVKTKRKRAGWDNDYLASLLFTE